MKSEPGLARSGFRRLIQATAVLVAVASCTETADKGSPYAPGVDPSGKPVDEVAVGNRLMIAGEYELAIESFTRAALVDGMTPKS